MIFFTSDLHLGHENCIRLCNRPFSSIEEMDETLIENWNHKVTGKDTVYILGDLIYRSQKPPEEYLRRLRGKKHLILGNHDRGWIRSCQTEQFFESVNNLLYVADGKRQYTLCHYPMMSWPHIMRCYMVFGHIHGNTDADYWPLIQANERMLNAGVPTIEDFLKERMREGDTLGFDGRVICALEGKKYERELSEKKIRIAFQEDLAESIWEDRPAFPAGRITVLDEKIAGKSLDEKLKETRRRIGEEGAESLLLTKLDDLMWLFNIRGCDVECNPVAMSYGFITMDKAVLFLRKKAMDMDTEKYLSRHKIQVEDYDSITDYLRGLPKNLKVMADPRHCSYLLYRILCERWCFCARKHSIVCQTDRQGLFVSLSVQQRHGGADAGLLGGGTGQRLCGG